MSNNPQSLISAHDLWLRRGGRELFSGLSLELNQGGLTWLRAPNGRGKTTLLRILAGFIQPEQGALHWRGQAFALRHEENRQAISFLDEKLGLGRDLSVRQNLQFAVKLSGNTNFNQILLQLKLDKLAARPVGQLSTGQKKRCAMARLLAESAQVWLLDEPANGLDAENRALLCELIEQHLVKGGSCVFSSHDALPFQKHQPNELELEQA
ncbi:MAG: heme ABC exporter ATP-binding protein CcmA [Oceanococcus sp.]